MGLDERACTIPSYKHTNHAVYGYAMLACDLDYANSIGSHLRAYLHHAQSAPLYCFPGRHFL